MDIADITMLYGAQPSKYAPYSDFKLRNESSASPSKRNSWCRRPQQKKGGRSENMDIDLQLLPWPNSYNWDELTPITSWLYIMK